MNWLTFLPLVLLALLIVSSAVYAFVWASKSGEFHDLEAQSRSIFDATEPEGIATDFFPGRAPVAPTAATPAPKARLLS